jgi:hypothetical protein
MRRGLIPVLAVLAAGCGGPTNPGGSPPPATATATGEVDLKAVTVADFNSAVAAHKGKVVYIDCWFLH